MSYQVLARKYRPQSFSEVVGQTHVLNSVIHALDNDKLHHAYLFSGTRGVGKTSLARLLAKSLNCLQGISSKPCGQCDNCQAIEQGRFVDLIEIDAASRTKVEDTRELLDNVQYMPTQGRYKVYLIDEVHMLSNHSFNALLKTLEEPPEHVKFLLATTDPQKLPITILSRCLQLHLKHLTPLQISNKITDILQTEHINFDQSALAHIAQAADGSMRDALSLTDQAIAYGNGSINNADVLNMLGIIDQQMIDTLVNFLLDRNIQKLSEYAQEIILSGKNPEAVLNALASCFYAASLYHFNAKLPSSEYSQELVEKLAKSISANQLQLYYQLSIKAKEDLPLAPTPECGLGMALLRLCAFDLHPITQQGLANKTIKPQKPPTTKDIKTAFSSAKRPLEESHKPELNNTQRHDSHVSTNTTTATDQPEKASNVKDEKPTKQIKQFKIDSNIDLSKLAAHEWHKLAHQLNLRGTAQQIIFNALVVSQDNNHLVLEVSDHVKALITDNSTQKIQSALCDCLNKKLTVGFLHLNDQPINSNAQKKTQTSTVPLQQAPKENDEHASGIDESFSYSNTTDQQTVAQTELTVSNIKQDTSKPKLTEDNKVAADKVTPAQIHQVNKEKQIQNIFEQLQSNPNIQALQSVGFSLDKKDIKLKK